MITKTYINKFNTIIKDSDLNTGLNPIAELCYGANNTRILCYFDVEHVKRLWQDKTMPNIEKLSHTLKITNAGSLDLTQIHQCETSSISGDKKVRATSFDLIFFLIPKEWDRGKGFDYTTNAFTTDFYTKHPIDENRFISKDGCNWKYRKTALPWDEPGIYSSETLSKEYDKFSSNEGSDIVFARQRFDIGNENIEIDITEIFNKFLTGELENNGIGIAFTPLYEMRENKFENYIGFLTDKTNTFFAPYIETKYDDYISDDRTNFILDKPNKLYLYANAGGKLVNLDNLPSCSINGTDYEVKQATKGVYYVELTLSHTEYEPDTMLFDVWDNIVCEGVKFDPVELEFVLKKPENWFNFGQTINENPTFTPSLSGISAKERIKRGDIRKLTILARENYTVRQAQSVKDIEVRLYVKDGTREIDVFPWEYINTTMNGSYIMIDTNILIPQRYYVDVRFTCDNQVIIHHNSLSFDIVDDLNNKYA